MQIENDYDKEVYNGDIGFVTEVDPGKGDLTASFDGRSGDLWLWRTRRTSAAIRGQHSQEPRLGIPSRGDSGDGEFQII